VSVFKRILQADPTAIAFKGCVIRTKRKHKSIAFLLGKPTCHFSQPAVFNISTGFPPYSQVVMSNVMSFTSEITA
jgi:hypothetical protein